MNGHSSASTRGSHPRFLEYAALPAAVLCFVLLGQVALFGTDVIDRDNVTTLAETQAWSTNGVPVLDAAFSLTGDEIYLAHGNQIAVWNSANGSMLRQWNAHPSYTPGLAISPDGTVIAAAGSDGVVRTWDAASGDLQKELSPAGTHTVAYSHSGELIGSVGRDSGLRAWDTESGDPVWTTAISGSVFSLDISPDDAVVVTAHGLPDFAIRAWSVATGELLWESFEHEADAHEVRFSPDGETIASIGADTLVILWDAATGDHLRTLRGHQQPLFSMIFLSDQLLASGDGGGTVRIWDLETGQTVKTLRGHNSEVCALAVSPDGTTLASASFDMEIILWAVP